MPRREGQSHAATGGLPLVSRRPMAEALGLSLRAFSDLEATGILVPVRRGRGGRASKYDVLATVRTYIAHLETVRPAGSDRVARARRDETQAQLNELRLAERRAELLPVDEITRVWSLIVVAVRARLLAMPRALADQCAQATTPAAAERILHDEIYAALRELAAWQPPAERAEPREPAPGSAPRARSPRR